jgi:tetratricopeptide (TPR) repeat protein
MLLRGHVLHSLHRFKEGEVVARELVARRGLSFDYGLLGDVLMEQGKLDEAVIAYQTMMDQKPSPEAYSRAAHVRWLEGDLDGAIELMAIAVGGGGEAESWMRARLAFYELQAGHAERAASLVSQDDYPPALLVRGRILLAEGQNALEPLQRAAQATMLPEYLWTLADAQRVAGRLDEAKNTEQILKRRGPQDDPRTYALYLATRGEDVETALRLAQTELETRADVFTLDALAWALHAAGKTTEAQAMMRRALAEGTQDARLALHAAVILDASTNFRQELLLPSEQTIVKNLTKLEAKK